MDLSLVYIIKAEEDLDFFQHRTYPTTLQSTLLDLKPGFCYTFWSIVQIFFCFLVYKKESFQDMCLWKSSSSHTIQSKKAMSLYISTALNKTTKSCCMQYSFTGQKVLEISMWTDVVLLLWGWLRGVGAVLEVRMWEHEKRPPRREARTGVCEALAPF